MIRGGVKVQKRDFQSGDGTPEGSAAFEGAVFTITNISEHRVIVDGKSYEPDEVVAQITTDENGLAQTTSDLLPYGTYKITEITPPRGYLGEGILETIFFIREDGRVVDMTGEDQAILNQVIRGDFELTKIDSDTQNVMANIPFRITSNTTGESHTFTTDANGFYSSSSEWNLHSHNTNMGGAEDGLWFGLDAGGNLVEVNDDLGALPFDTYTIEELGCEANADKVLYKGMLTISRHGYTVDMGNIENEAVNTPAIYTSARNEDTGTAYGIAREGTVIIDTVTYTGLTPGETYTLQGTLMNAATGKTVMDKDTPVTVEKTFKAILENGTIDVEFVFESSGLSGADVVVFEKLFYDGEEVASHEDLEDEGQTIHFPGIGTTVRDSVTGTNMGALQESTTLVDTVAYTNLQMGRSYTLTGTLMDQATGLPLLSANGQEITVTKTFIPKTSSGTVEVSFVLNTSDLAGKSVVVFEQLSRGIVIYAAHEDISDEGQTIHFPEIGTTASDGVTGEHIGNAGMEKVTVIDTVVYKNLVPGKEYTVSGTLMDKATGKALTYDGKPFIAEKTFTPKEANGSIELAFTVPGLALLGKAVVVFESLAYEGITVGIHANISDEEQTVYYPQMGTTAIDSETGSHYALADGKVTVKDTVAYQTLIPGKNYVMTGTLINKETGDPIMDGEESLTVTKAFTPKTSDGSIEIVFTFDASALAGSDVVAFETLTLNDTLLASHEDLEDESQTIRFPKIGTTALDSETKDHIAKADKEVTLVDTVTYENLEPGTEYTLTGTLMDKSTGEALVIGETAITSEVTFTPEKASGSQDVTFIFDGTCAAGKDLVVFERLSVGGHLLAIHEDLEDKGQTVRFPDIKTTATDSETGDHVGNAAVAEVTIIDALTYTHLIPGKEYTVSGILMDKATGKELTYEGKTFTAVKTFVPEETSGSVELTFTVPGKALMGKAAVVFEDMAYMGISVGTHGDIEDEEQTVYYPEVKTTAVDQLTGTHQGFAREKVLIMDEVAYTGVRVGYEYTIEGVLIDKSTGEPYMADGQEIRAKKTFTAKTMEGSATLEFEFDGTDIKDSSFVVFESLYYKDKKVGSHEDLADEGQTVSYPKIDLGTEAKDKASGTHEAAANETVTIIDSVSYTNLIPGREYKLQGILMDKDAGDTFLVNGESVTAQITFVPEQPDGTVEMEFKFDTTGLEDKSLVVFEALFYEDVLIAVHEDINDMGQTVTIDLPETSDHEIPQTGLSSTVGLMAGSGAGLIVLGLSLWIRFRKKHHKPKI